MILKGFFKRAHLPSALSIVLIFVVASCVSRPDSSDVAEQTTEHVASADTLYVAPSPDNGGRDAILEASVPAMRESTLRESREEKAEARIEPEHKAKEAEATVPVVEPRKVEPRKAYIESTIRIQVVGDASSIALGGDGELVLNFGSNFMKLGAGSRMRFKPRSARVSVRSYSVGVATFAADEYEGAMKSAQKWKSQGYTVRLIKAGGPLVQADGTIADTTVYWIALGMFKERKAAERFKDKMFNRGISCWVIDESVLEPRGNIELLDARGHPKAYADSRVIITSDAPIRIFDVPFGHGFWDSGNREDRNYLSPIEVIVDKKGKLAAINEVRLEEYVKGVVPVEIRPTAHNEALKAQAVSARTEAMAKLGIQHVFDPYDFCASQHCQEFGGLARRTPRTDAAVNATRGQVIMCDGSLVDAVYSANCGGHTEHNENVWSSRPVKSLRGVSDLYENPTSLEFPLSQSQLREWVRSTPRAYCADPRVSNRKNIRWRVRYSAKEMNEMVNRHRSVGSVKDIKVLRRGISGRALCIKIEGDRGPAIINKELQIRRVLGGLKSSMFVVDIERDSSGRTTSFVFDGGGWGHGVGMCQAGAEGMALRGFSYSHILKHYYSKIEISKLYE